MVWTIIFNNKNGNLDSLVLTGPNDFSEMMSHLDGKTFWRDRDIVCLIRGNHRVMFNM